MLNQLLEKFKELYGGNGDIRTYFAPGRVNLIGEHTDYNGGHVFPCALTFGTYAVARKREDDVLRFYSVNFERDGIYASSLNDLVPKKQAGWTNYPKGVMWAFEKRNYHLTSGLDIVIGGNIPNGSGLSSSASLEVLTGLVLRDMFELDQITNQELALIGQDSENNFNGMNCGIMDQFASAMGKKDCAIFLDTATLECEYAPLQLENAKIVITNSNVKHSLVNSAYNERRSQCETALAQLQTVRDIKTLGDLTEEEFEEIKDAITDPICRKRAKHAVYENIRTIKAVDALKANDLVTFGKLMNASHTSLQYDYEVSCDEIDVLVSAAWGIPGVIGSRITGGGFGGCTVSLVENDKVESFKEIVGKTYTEKTGLHADFYIVSCGEGAHKIS